MKFSNGLRIFVLVLCLMMAALMPFSDARFFGVLSAQAEESGQILRIFLAAQPDALVEPGDVTLLLNIENISSADAHNVYLSSADGLLSEPIGQLDAGKTQVLTRTHSVTQSELEAGYITYIISHDDPAVEGRKVNYSVQTSIHKSDLLPQVEFTRQFSSRYVTPGSTVTISYRIRNTGNVALSALRVQDALGDFTGRVERLEVGESRTLISRVTLNEAGSSLATLSYDVEALDGESFSTALAEAPIRMAYGQIDAVLSAGYSAFSTDTADVVLLLTNLGNVEYRNIRVTDDIYGGVIADNVILPSGSADPLEISCKYPVRGSEGFRWRITGISEAGEHIDIVTDTVMLNLPVVSYPAEIAFEPEVQMPVIRRAGEVPVRIRIENTGDADITDLHLYETSRGELKTFLILPAGDSIEREISVYVREAGDLNFTLSYRDINGNERGVIAAPQTVTISSEGELPLDAQKEPLDFSGYAVRIGESSAFVVLLIAGTAVLLVLVVTLLIVTRRAKQEKKLRIAAERQRRKNEGVKAGNAGKSSAAKANPSARKAKK